MKQVLIENYEYGLVYGHSENYIPVKSPGDPNDINEIIPVKLVQIVDDEMIGEKQV